jgi:hypothetical protein
MYTCLDTFSQESDAGVVLGAASAAQLHTHRYERPFDRLSSTSQSGGFLVSKRREDEFYTRAMAC